MMGWKIQIIFVACIVQFSAVNCLDDFTDNADVLRALKCEFPPNPDIMETIGIIPITPFPLSNAENFCRTVLDLPQPPENVEFIQKTCKHLFERYQHFCLVSTKSVGIEADPVAQKLTPDALRKAFNFGAGVSLCQYITSSTNITQTVGLHMADTTNCHKICEEDSKTANLCKLVVSVSCQMESNVCPPLPLQPSDIDLVGATNEDPDSTTTTFTASPYGSEDDKAIPEAETVTHNTTTPPLTRVNVTSPRNIDSTTSPSRSTTVNTTSAGEVADTTKPSLSATVNVTSVGKVADTTKPSVSATVNVTSVGKVADTTKPSLSASVNVTSTTTTTTTSPLSKINGPEMIPGINSDSTKMSEDNSISSDADTATSVTFMADEDDDDFIPRDETNLPGDGGNNINNPDTSLNSDGAWNPVNSGGAENPYVNSVDGGNPNVNSGGVGNPNVNSGGLEKTGILPSPESPSSGHFFAYFLTAVVICISGYVIFHNKKKILAFVIEGRDAAAGGGRRKTKNGVQYSQLQSNVEEVIPSLDKATSVKNFVY